MRKKLIFSLVGLLMLVGAASAFALGPEAQTYKEEVEPICQANTEANEKILKGVRKEVREGKTKKASRQLFAAAKALKRARAQLVKVPKPAEDGARLPMGLTGVKPEVDRLEATGRKLAKGEKNAAVRMVARLESNARKTNTLVLDYQFRYCRFNPAKFL
ncbi:MAG: hypothetical protein ACTHN7_11020 [Solirubrobacterales bacterium]